MNYIDLSQTFGENMPVYPGDPVPEIIQMANIIEQGYTDFQLKTGMHVGTHIDAPLHFIEGGKRLSEIPVDSFFGKARLIDARGRKIIDQDVLQIPSIHSGDILLIFTGHSQFFGRDLYYLEYPILSENFAQKVVALGVKMIGLDTPSPDRAPYAVHKILLAREILIIENLTNLHLLQGFTDIDLIALPPKIALEAAPVRAVARIE